MSGDLRQYIPQKLLCSFSLVQAVPGFDLADINLREGLVRAPHIDGGRREQTWDLQKDGSDNGMYTQMAGAGVDTSGTLSFTYQQGSITNKYLSLLLQADETTQGAIGTIQIKDLVGTTLVRGSGCRLQGWPPVSFSAVSGTDRTWTFWVNSLSVFLGDSDLIG